MTANPYEAPASKVGRVGVEETISLYSPNQIAVTTFLAGPLAAIYFLRSNFSALNKFELAGKTLSLGCAFLALLIVAVLYLPEGFPSIVIPVVYTILAQNIAKTMQVTKETIVNEEKYSFFSNWKVLGAGIISLIVFAILMIAAVFAMLSLGIGNID